MNAQRKKAAVSKYTELKNAGATKEEVADQVSADEKNYTKEEAAEIVSALFVEEGKSKQPQEVPQTNKPPMAVKSNSPNAALDLSRFDYKNLKGKMFKEYVELVGDRSFIVVEDGEAKAVSGTLLDNDHLDFELFKVKPIRQVRYVGVPDSPIDYVGVEILQDKPIHTTRIPVKTALEFNAQILNAHSVAGHGKYYLLKK